MTSDSSPRNAPLIRYRAEISEAAEKVVKCAEDLCNGNIVKAGFVLTEAIAIIRRKEKDGKGRDKDKA